MTDDIKRGLEGVIVDTTALSRVDGLKGELVYRGYMIDDLARHKTFEDVVFLLFEDRLPSAEEREALRAELAAARPLDPRVVDLLRACRDGNPMDALRTAVSMIGTLDPEAADDSPEANRRKAMRLIGQAGAAVAAFHEIREGREPAEAPASDDTATAFMRAVRGGEPDAHFVRVFDACLTLHADHGFNASTFSARVTASTMADLHGAVTSAIGTLKGPLHGGANTRVMEMLLDLGSEDKVEAYVEKALANKERIMGFGHRVYKVLDPRAIVLRELSLDMAGRGGEDKWLRMSDHMREVMKERKGIDPNVDFYSASLYYVMGIPVDLYTPIFAMSRMAGWTAHVLEQKAANRLIRPKALYTGAEGRTTQG